MIEKLKTINPYDETEIDMDVGSVNLVYENTPLVQKINELIEAVNELQKQVKEIMTWRFETDDELQMKLEPEKCEIPTDKYAEQRKWIGKVCRFFDSDKDDARIGVLSAIQNGMYFIKHTSTAYDYCEPVKQDDDIIYRGE